MGDSAQTRSGSADASSGLRVIDLLAAIRAANYDVVKLRGDGDQDAERQRLAELLGVSEDVIDQLAQIPRRHFGVAAWVPPTEEEQRMFDTSSLLHFAAQPRTSAQQLFVDLLSQIPADLVIDQNHSDGALAPLWATPFERKLYRKYPFLRFSIERRKKVVRAIAVCITLIAAGTIIRHIYRKGSR